MKCLLASAAFLVPFALAQAASASVIIAGNGGGASASTVVPMDIFEARFDVGAQSNRFDVDCDTGAGPWLNILTSSAGGNLIADDSTSSPTYTIFSFYEHLKIGGLVPVTGWIEELNTPGWVWTGDSIPTPPCFIFVNSVNVTSSTTRTYSTDNVLLTFAFPTPLVAGDRLDIVKNIAFVGPDHVLNSSTPDTFSSTVSISETPLPEPTTLSLLGAGGVALLCRRRRSATARIGVKFE